MMQEIERRDAVELARDIVGRVMFHPCNVLVTGTSAAQAGARLDAIADALPAWIIDKRRRVNGAQRVILKDGSTLRAQSRRARGYARGYSIDLVVVDELLTDEDRQELEPALITRNGMLVSLGKDKW